MTEVGMNQLLSQLRTLSAQAQGKPGLSSAEVAAPQSGFQTLLKNSIEGVSQAQSQAESLARAFETGEANTDLASVMVAMQKASVSFQGMVQVRNKLVSAYQEIMSMQV